jgi:glucose/arabinose dehydrogenase
MLSRRLSVPLIIVIIIVIAGATLWYNQEPETAEEQLEYTVLARNLDVPWSLDIASNGDIIFTERNGNVKLLREGIVHTIHSIDVDHQRNRESGLLGITFSPDYPEDPRVYLYYTYRATDGIWNKVSFFTFRDMQLFDENILLDHIPAGSFHDGGRIKFGPDGKLYVTTGDAGIGDLAQDLGSYAGKILRINNDGSIPDDNPFQNSPVYSFGHRNPQGLAWHPDTDELYITEHGPSGEGLRFAHDEINLIEPGANYGWPGVIGDGNNPEYVDPVFHTGDDTWAPSGATFLDDPDNSWHGRLFIANLKGTSIVMIDFSPGYRHVEVYTMLFTNLGRIRTLVQGPERYLYFCTNV